jgi:hypothetical protein
MYHEILTTCTTGIPTRYLTIGQETVAVLETAQIEAATLFHLDDVDILARTAF